MNMKYVVGLLMLLAALHLSPAYAVQLYNANTSAADRTIESCLNKMTADEKIGQMLMVGWAASEVDNLLSELINKYHIGSVILFERNIKNMRHSPITPEDKDRVISTNTAQLCNSIQELASRTRLGIPILIAADQEGGKTLIIEKGVTFFPSNMAIGASRQEEFAFQAGRITAEELRAMGVQMNLAPVADIHRNIINDIIGDRSFGGDPELVARMSVQLMSGLHRGGMLSVAKHFPGHGDSQADPHYKLPQIQLDKEHIENVNMYPFKELARAGVDGILTAHMVVPALEKTNQLPVSLSKTVIKNYIREYLKFNGTVITDDLIDMKAVRIGGGSIHDIAGEAVDAGNDILMFAHIPYPPEWKDNSDGFVFNLETLADVFEVLREYFTEHPAQLDESVERILRLKLKINPVLEADRWKVDLSRLKDIIRSREHLKWSQKISDGGITLVHDQFNLFSGGSAPLQKIGRTGAILVVAPVFQFDDLTPMIKETGLIDKKKVTTITIKYGLKKQKLTDKEISDKAQAIIDNSQDKKLVIFGIVNKSHVKILRAVMPKIKTDLLAIAFHEPNLLELPDIGSLTYLAAYSNLAVSNAAVARVLKGDVIPKPKKYLPVRITGVFEDLKLVKIVERPPEFAELLEKGRAQLGNEKCAEARTSFEKALAAAQNQQEKDEARKQLTAADNCILDKLPPPPGN